MQRHNSIDVEGVTVHYLEKNKEASPTLFFLHGNSCSLNYWRKQIQSPLFSTYRLVAFDLPGHGKSGMPPDGECSLIGLAKIMVRAILQIADSKPFIVIGVSLATNMVAEMLYEKFYPVGIVLAGPCLVNEHYTVEKLVKPGTHVHVVFTEDAPAHEVHNYALETSLSRDEWDIKCFEDDYFSTQSRFRCLLAKSIGDKVYRDEIEIFRQQRVPTLAVMGADERIVYPDYLDDADLPFWNDTIYKIDGASHLVNIDQPERFNSLFCAFLKDVFK